MKIRRNRRSRINENHKVTLTLDQLKRFVRESNEPDSLRGNLEEAIKILEGCLDSMTTSRDGFIDGHEYWNEIDCEEYMASFENALEYLKNALKMC